MLHHLVNNARISSVYMFEDTINITDFHTVMDTNFWGSVYATRGCLRNSRGKIVVLSSIASWLPVPRLSSYNVSKAAMVAFYETLRVELGSDVMITLVTPGFIESKMTQTRA